jgi:hypothetical protein
VLVSRTFGLSSVSNTVIRGVSLRIPGASPVSSSTSLGPKCSASRILTPSVFERYNITDDRDRSDAVAKVAAAMHYWQVLDIGSRRAARA